MASSFTNPMKKHDITLPERYFKNINEIDLWKVCIQAQSIKKEKNV